MNANRRHQNASWAKGKLQRSPSETLETQLGSCPQEALITAAGTRWPLAEMVGGK